MNAMLTPPPERDLPDHAAVRHRVVRATVRRRPQRARLLPVVAAAGVALVGGVAAAAGAGWLDLPRSGPAAVPSGDVRLLDPDSVVRQCLGPSPAPTPDPAPLPPDPSGSTLLGEFSDATGTMAVVGRTGAGGGVATCDLDRSGRVNGGGSVQSFLQPWAADFDPARQAVVVDLAESRVGLVGTATSSPDAPTIHDVVGRVAPGVTRVAATWADGQRVQAAVQDGLYAARRVGPPAGGITPMLTVTVTAYDAHGRLLGTATGGGPLPSDTALPTSSPSPSTPAG